MSTEQVEAETLLYRCSECFNRGWVVGVDQAMMFRCTCAEGTRLHNVEASFQEWVVTLSEYDSDGWYVADGGSFHRSYSSANGPSLRDFVGHVRELCAMSDEELRARPRPPPPLPEDERCDPCCAGWFLVRGETDLLEVRRCSDCYPDISDLSVQREAEAFEKRYRDAWIQYRSAPCNECAKPLSVTGVVMENGPLRITCVESRGGCGTRHDVKTYQQVPTPYQPRFEHNCDDCEYLGHVEFPAAYFDAAVPYTKPKSADLYFCKVSGIGGEDSLLARYSDRGSDYSSSSVSIVRGQYLRMKETSTHSHTLVTAFYFALAKRLVQL